MTPGEFLYEVVRPNADEFQANFDDMRRAFNAIAAVDALAAHIYEWSKSNSPDEVNGINNDSQYRGRLADKEPDFGLLRDLAKAQKHVRLIHGNPQITGSSHVEVRSLGFGTGAWDEMRWDGPPQICVQTKAGDVRAIDALVKKCLDFLEVEMTRLAIP